MADVVDLSQPTGSVLPFLAKLLSKQPYGPPVPPQDADVPAPPLQVPGQDAAPPPPAATQQQPGDVSGISSLAQPDPQDQGKPQLAGETKGHKLLRILMGAGYGAAAGAGQRTFGGGFQQAQELPLALQHESLQNQQLAQTLPFLRATQMAGLQKTLADTNKTNLEAQGLPAKQQLAEAQAEAANYKEDPNLGLIDLRTRQPVTNAAVAPLTAAEAAVLGKNPGDRVPLKLKNTANEIAMRGISTVNTEQGVYERNRQTGSMTRLGDNPRMMFAPGERYVQVADPQNPGNTIFMKAGEAAQTGAAGTQSAALQVPKAAAKAEVPTKIGDQKVAFTTMIQHADLLRRAAQALHNGDIQTLNGLENAFKNEFGYSGPITASAIADAYKGEVSNVINKGHITDQGNEKIAHTLDPTKQNFETIDSVLGAYQALAQSKMNMLNKQEQDAISNSQSNKGSGTTGTKGDPLKLFTNGR